jgi:hypothetical protein
MKNIQIVDGAANATYSIFQATDQEFETIFPKSPEKEKGPARRYTSML